MKGGRTDTLWHTVKYSVLIFQNAAFLEVGQLYPIIFVNWKKKQSTA